MRKLILPKNYKSPLDIKQTEKAIKLVKDTFQDNLSSELKVAPGYRTSICPKRYRG